MSWRIEHKPNVKMCLHENLLYGNFFCILYENFGNISSLVEGTLLPVMHRITKSLTSRAPCQSSPFDHSKPKIALKDLTPIPGLFLVLPCFLFLSNLSTSRFTGK